MFEKFLNMMNLSNEDEDNYDDEDFYIDEQEDVIADPVLTVNVNVVGGKIPDLDHRKCCHYICHKSSRLNEPLFKVMQKQIVAADDIYEDQIIDQFHVFHFFLFWPEDVVDHICILSFWFMNCFVYHTTTKRKTGVKDAGSFFILIYLE